ncbi:unnamed protein product [Rotaria socialis]
MSGLSFGSYYPMKDIDVETASFVCLPITSNKSGMKLLASNDLYLRYLTEYGSIPGWVNYGIFYVLWVIIRFQYEELHINDGAIGEIGVHAGKLTSYLYLLRHLNKKQKLFAIDVFGKKELNIDKSGDGDRKVFLSYIQRYANVTADEVNIYEGSSLDLNSDFSKNLEAQRWWQTTIKRDRGCQLVSIDGGHTTLTTYSDMCVISNSLVDGGVVMVDDIDNPGWLGVRDGVSKFLCETSNYFNIRENLDLTEAATKNVYEPDFNYSCRIVKATMKTMKFGCNCYRLAPFLKYDNKLFLTTPNYYAHYVHLLKKINENGTNLIAFNKLRYTVGNIPVWADSELKKVDIFDKLVDDSLVSISVLAVRSRLLCSAACNQIPSCRIFDYDSNSQCYRHFESDLTNGSHGLSVSPKSIVGILMLSTSLFTPLCNQSCGSCPENRYQLCSLSTNTCQCPAKTYSNGSMCALQLFQNMTCNQIDVCRIDLNLSYAIDCYCATSTTSNVITAVGSCNGSCTEVLSKDLTTLHVQAGIFVSSNGTLYVADGLPVNKIFALEPNQQIVWSSNATIPPSGITGSCALNKLSGPNNFAFDSFGNIYISSSLCHLVAQWALNATNGTLVTGSPLGTLGSTNLLLNQPYGLALYESLSILYVSNRNNNRIQKFILGNLTGVTIAGGNDAGSASNQLYRPTTIILPHNNSELYICDTSNN